MQIHAAWRLSRALAQLVGLQGVHTWGCLKSTTRRGVHDDWPGLFDADQRPTPNEIPLRIRLWQQLGIS